MEYRASIMDTRFPPVPSLPCFGICLPEFLAGWDIHRIIGELQFLKPSLKLEGLRGASYVLTSRYSVPCLLDRRAYLHTPNSETVLKDVNSNTVHLLT
jgi:hypothetical protein